MTAPSGEEDIEENKKVLKTVFLLCLFAAAASRKGH
jgi:hypothetical protein